MRLGQNHPLKLKKDWNLSFFSNSSPFTSRKIKLQLYAAYIFLNLLPSKPVLSIVLRKFLQTS